MKVAIDVVPIRNTGEMGGAFQTVIELIKGLAVQNTQDQYFLLTADWNHEYFGQFEKYGIQRILVHSAKPASELKFSQNRYINKIRNILARLMGRAKKMGLIGGSILRERSIDVLFCPMSAISYAEPGIPTVSIIYDLQHEYYPQFFADEELQHRRNFYNGIGELADYVACISTFTKNSFVELLNFPIERAEVIPISIHNREGVITPSERQSVLEKYKLSNHTYLYYPANYWPHKNHRMLLVALAMYTKKYPEQDLHLCLTGSQLDRDEEFQEMLRQMGLSNRVHHLGYVTDREVVSIMSCSSGLIFPSLFEGFGIPVAEAMSLGVPVLCSNNTSLPEVGGDAVCYFDPRRPEEMVEKMHAVIHDVELRNCLIDKGFKQVVKFDEDQMVKQYHTLLSRAAQTKTKRRYAITGIYQDNWTGRSVSVELEEAEGIRLLIAVLHLPEVQPNKEVKIKIIIGQLVKQITIHSGETYKLEEEITDSAVSVTIDINETFVPSQIGIPDERELGIQISVLSIMDGNGQVKSLHGKE